MMLTLAILGLGIAEPGHTQDAPVATQPVDPPAAAAPATEEAPSLDSILSSVLEQSAPESSGPVAGSISQTPTDSTAHGVTIPSLTGGAPTSPPIASELPSRNSEPAVPPGTSATITPVVPPPLAAGPPEAPTVIPVLPPMDKAPEPAATQPLPSAASTPPQSTGVQEPAPDVRPATPAPAVPAPESLPPAISLPVVPVTAPPAPAASPQREPATASPPAPAPAPTPAESSTTVTGTPSDPGADMDDDGADEASPSTAPATPPPETSRPGVSQEEQIESAYRRAQAGKGRMDGAWLVSDASGRIMYRLQLVEPGRIAPLEGAWSDPRTPAAMGSRGFIDDISTSGDEFRIRIHRKAGQAVLTVKWNAGGTLSGELNEAGSQVRIVMKRP